MNRSSLQRIAATDFTVLITGKTGTGKTTLAEKIHNLSSRKNQRFVAINLATLNENVVESELFGHEKGAYSSADSKRVGKLEYANGGTVLLDEIGEISERMQCKLLEVLNSRKISPVGSNREVTLDVRFITATNKDLRQLVEKKQFREDLYFRLNTFQIELENINSDLDRLRQTCKQVLSQLCFKMNREYPLLDASFWETIEGYSWPGNYRELVNAIEYALTLNPEGKLCGADLPAYTLNRSVRVSGGQFPVHYCDFKAQVERDYLEVMLKRFQGGINATARGIKMSKVSLIKKVREYQIDVGAIKYKAQQRNTFSDF